MFKNRAEAGLLLAPPLKQHANTNSIVLGIPRGGVVTAAAVAEKLNLPLAAVVVKKIPAPHQSELAIGAIGPAGTVYYNKDVIRNLGLSKKELAKQAGIARFQQQEYQEKFQSSPVRLKGKTVLLVDDGIATGATVLCAIAYLRRRNVDKIVLAVPVIHPDVMEVLLGQVDVYVVLEESYAFASVGQFYREFEQVEEEEVVRLLGAYRAR
ncbi:phosphoribosyltransferase [Candidatus Roizmanbacteria bacterium]|nr:phosphoribosyltransferase [Candidatus Roizmanbacteria bacterium]